MRFENVSRDRYNKINSQAPARAQWNIIHYLSYESQWLYYISNYTVAHRVGKKLAHLFSVQNEHTSVQWSKIKKKEYFIFCSSLHLECFYHSYYYRTVLKIDLFCHKNISREPGVPIILWSTVFVFKIEKVEQCT